MNIIKLGSGKNKGCILTRNVLLSGSHAKGVDDIHKWSLHTSYELSISDFTEKSGTVLEKMSNYVFSSRCSLHLAYYLYSEE